MGVHARGIGNPNLTVLRDAYRGLKTGQFYFQQQMFLTDHPENIQNHSTSAGRLLEVSKDVREFGIEARLVRAGTEAHLWFPPEYRPGWVRSREDKDLLHFLAAILNEIMETEGTELLRRFLAGERPVDLIRNGTIAGRKYRVNNGIVSVASYQVVAHGLPGRSVAELGTGLYENYVTISQWCGHNPISMRRE